MNFNSNLDDLGNEAGIKDIYADEKAPEVTHTDNGESEDKSFFEQAIDHLIGEDEEE